MYHAPATAGNAPRFTAAPVFRTLQTNPFTPPVVFSSFLPPRTLLTLGPFTIQWYGLFAALGALAAYLLARRLARQAHIPDETFGDAFFAVLIIGLIGARIWHVFADLGYYQNHPADIIAIWKGGLAIHGGILAGLLTLMLYANRQRLSFWLLADILAPAGALGQAIGRWGNYFNQELFGQPTTLPWGIPIRADLRPPDTTALTRFHPTFLYESLGLLAIAVLLTLVFRWRARQTGPLPNFFHAGTLFGLYLALTGLLRAGVESLRIDPVLQVESVRVPQLVSLAVLIFGLLIVLRSIRKPFLSPTA